MARLPARYELPLFALLLSGLMSLLVSGVATFNAIGPVAGFTTKWLAAWLGSWAVAFPAVMVVAPLVRRVVARCVQPRG
jgi:hypothetical protein